MGGGGACVSCRGTLRVETVSTEDPSQPLYNVVITANGPGGFSRTRTSRRRRGRAIASFGRVRPGNYTIVIGGGNAAEGAVQARQTTELTVRLAVPSITVGDPKVVLVKKQYQDGTDGLNPHRIRVQLRASSNFGGTGRFTCNHTNHIRLYDAETGGNQINLPYDIPGGELAAGKTVYVEGAQPSVRMNNTRLTLTLQGGSPAGWGTAREDITCVELKLEICKWRTSSRVYPTPFTEQEKMDPGRYVSLYDGQGSTERAMMILHKARPHNYNGTLSLIPLDNRVQVFESEQGGAALPNPYRIANRSVSPSGKRLWVQGANVSGGLRDTGFRLELQNPANKEGDRVRITVVRLRMDSCKARTAAGVDPVPFSNNDKVTIGRFIHVQNPANQHERGKLIVNRVQPNAFNGTLVLTLVEPRRGNPLNKAQLFDNENPAAPAGQAAHANPYEFNHDGAFPATGRAFWLEGRNESRRARDTEVWLGIRDHIKRGDRVPVTVVKGFLDIYQSRTRRNRDPRAMTPQDKVNVGRFVHIQMGNHHGRALTVAKRLKPNDANCRLVFTVCDTAGAASNRVQLFDQEVAPAGAAQANPLEVAHDGTFPRNGKRLWAQGNTVSGALRDTEIRLGIKDHITRYDRVALTVVRFRELRAEIPSTPAQTVRMGNSPVATHNFPVAAPGAPTANDYDVDFTNNEPLVLLENSIPGANLVNLRVNVEPANVPVSWDVKRDRRSGVGDHARVTSLRNNPAAPTITRNAGDRLRATLQSNAVGSFHICPYVDCNGNNSLDFDDGRGRRIDREPFMIMNLVLARVTLHRDNSIARSGRFRATPVAGNGIRVRSGTFNINAPNTAAIHLNTLANVVGGGNDGRRGLDKVFAGWINNESANENIVGTFREMVGGVPTQRRSSSVFASNRASATGANNTFLPGNPAPALVPPALLDSGRGSPGTGGDTATLTRSRIRTRTNLSAGQRFLVEAVDSPGDGEGGTHPGFAAARLVNFQFGLDFRAYLCFWTNISRNSGATVDPANRLYGVLRRIDWRMRGQWNINPATGAITRVGVPSVQITARRTFNPLERAVSTPSEVRAPTGLNLLARDARA